MNQILYEEERKFPFEMVLYSTNLGWLLSVIFEMLKLTNNGKKMIANNGNID